jgi:hypothetical protein
VQIVVSFDPETFAEIRGRAIQQQTSFAEQIRLLVEWGLEAEIIAAPARPGAQGSRP